MTTHKLIMGLTDVRDEESFIFDENHIENYVENRQKVKDIRYNLYKQAPEIEKETLEWTFHIERPLVANLLKLWETVIRKPHLKMVNHYIFPHTFSPNYLFNRLNVSFINLLPSEPISANWANFEEEDYDYLQSIGPPAFGSIYIDNSSMVNLNGERIDGYGKSSLRYAIEHDSIEYLTSYIDHACLPNFDINLTPNYVLFETLVFPYSPVTIQNFFEKYEDELTALGYTVDNPRNKVGTYTIARMDTPAEKAHEIINKYNYVCRFSIVEED